jgi:hypothetical protein
MLEMKPTTAALTATRRPSNAGDDGEYDVEALAVDASYDGKLAPVTQLHELATGYEPQLATKDAELAQRERRIRELEIQLAKTMQQPPPTNAAEIGANEKKRHLAAIARTQCARSQSELRACVCVNGGRCGDGSPACLRREVVHADPLVLRGGRGAHRSSCCCCAHPRNRSVTPSACHQRARQASSVHAKLHLDRGVRFRKNIRPGRHSFPATEPGSTARSRARRGGAGTGRDGVERRTISALEGRAGPARGREGR